MLASTHPQCATNADTSIWICAWCKGLCLTSDTRISYCDTKVHLTWCISSCGVAVHTTLRGGEQDWVRILLLHTNILLLLLKFHYDYKIKNQRYMYIWPNIGEAVDLIVNLCRDLLVTYTALGDMCSYWLVWKLTGDLYRNLHRFIQTCSWLV